MTAMHKGILIGLLLGIVASMVWQRRQGSSSSPGV
jgi:hypothetical protein